MIDPVRLDLPIRLAQKDVVEALAGRKAFLTGRVAAVAGVPALASLPVIETALDAPENTELLVVVGGGTRIDSAKAWRGLQRPGCALLAIATRYGSGAEANDIAVIDDKGAKTIHIGPKFRPDARAYLPRALDDLSEAELMWSMGDALTHAVEGLLSPLAKPELRKDLGALVKEMLRLGPSRDPAWFELSAAASAGQAQASVGLVHGLAHTLEAPARAALGRTANQISSCEIGHARLCAALLAPVLRFNLARSNKAAQRLSEAGVDQAALLAQADALSTPALNLPLNWARLIETHWKTILSDVCTRTNVATVRPGTMPDLIAGLLSS